VWWGTILKDTGGTGFWHEGYLRRGGFEAVYLDMFEPIGMGTLLRCVGAGLVVLGAGAGRGCGRRPLRMLRLAKGNTTPSDRGRLSYFAVKTTYFALRMAGW